MHNHTWWIAEVYSFCVRGRIVLAVVVEQQASSGYTLWQEGIGQITDIDRHLHGVKKCFHHTRRRLYL